MGCDEYPNSPPGRGSGAAASSLGASICIIRRAASLRVAEAEVLGSANGLRRPLRLGYQLVSGLSGCFRDLVRSAHNCPASQDEEEQ